MMEQLQGKGWDGPARCHDLRHAEQHSVIMAQYFELCHGTEKNSPYERVETAGG